MKKKKRRKRIYGGTTSQERSSINNTVSMVILRNNLANSVSRLSMLLILALMMVSCQYTRIDVINPHTGVVETVIDKNDAHRVSDTLVVRNNFNAFDLAEVYGTFVGNEHIPEFHCYEYKYKEEDVRTCYSYYKVIVLK